MTTPKLSIATPQGRMYAREPGGTPVHPSITNVIETLSADMEWWEALCAANAAIEHSPLLGDVHNMPRGRAKWARERAAKDWLMGAAGRDRDAASARGDLVHDYAEQWARREIGAATSEDVNTARNDAVAGGAGAYLPHFEAFWAHWKPRVVAPEATVWNDTVGYAGTTDLLCEFTIRGRSVTAVLDWKTKKALWKRNGEQRLDLKESTALQLAAAAFAEEMWVEGSGWAPMPFVPQIGVGVAIGPDGWAARQYDIHRPAVWDTFAALRTAWGFKHGPATMTGRLQGPEHLILPEPALQRQQSA